MDYQKYMNSKDSAQGTSPSFQQYMQQAPSGSQGAAGKPAGVDFQKFQQYLNFQKFLQHSSHADEKKSPDEQAAEAPDAESFVASRPFLPMQIEEFATPESDSSEPHTERSDEQEEQPEQLEQFKQVHVSRLQILLPFLLISAGLVAVVAAGMELASSTGLLQRLRRPKPSGPSEIYLLQLDAPLAHV
eukprot:gb/GFBE01050462.1/.p1 GENE.gb/GFBE01050462.1/~~gb/GFBE01050462.1/.p1  ORF type:complete len:188 (+),score=63.70 gb/GFBE01050462.1/:1-564(+)